jgi:hypothetical protein
LEGFGCALTLCTTKSDAKELSYPPGPFAPTGAGPPAAAADARAFAAPCPAFLEFLDIFLRNLLFINDFLI